jgi:hypothetical protein
MREDVGEEKRGNERRMVDLFLCDECRVRLEEEEMDDTCTQGEGVLVREGDRMEVRGRTCNEVCAQVL